MQEVASLTTTADEIGPEEAPIPQFCLVPEHPGGGIENKLFRTGKGLAISGVEVLSAAQFPPPTDSGQSQARKGVEFWCHKWQRWSGIWISQMPVEIEDRQVAIDQRLDPITERVIQRRFVPDYPGSHENKLLPGTEYRA